MELSYDEIRRIHRLERSTSKLTELEPDFYEELVEFLSAEQDSYIKSLKEFSVGKTRAFTNLKRMVDEIFLLREKKLLNKALLASRTEERADERLPLPEKKVFEKILADLEAHNRILAGMFGNSTAGSSKKDKGSHKLLVRAISDVPAFVGADMDEYGPFSRDETVRLPEKVARLLVARKLCEIEE